MNHLEWSIKTEWHPSRPLKGGMGKLASNQSRIIVAAILRDKDDSASSAASDNARSF